MSKKKNIIINCSNIHYGGGVAVASSFLICLSKKNFKKYNINILISKTVFNNIKKSNIDFSNFKEVKIINNFGLRMLFFNFDKHFKKIDIIFSIFGPTFSLKQKHKHIIGLADPYIIYKNNFYIKKFSSLINRIKNSLIVFIRKKFLYNADAFIVEIERAKKEIERNKINQKKNIYVVSNSINDIFFKKELWSKINLNDRTDSLKLGIISRKYPHKNIEILPHVKEILENKYHKQTKIFVTLNEKEWSESTNFFKENITNVGPLLINECTNFYEQIDGVIFPTLLEVMSITPLESMFMSKPLFCSDFDFMHEICNKYAIYFNPLDPYDIAKKINDFFVMEKSKKQIWIKNSKNYINKFPNASQRCEKYMRIIQKELDQF